METQRLSIVCPHPECRGSVRIRDDGTARCARCRTELGVWRGRPTWAQAPADPRDWDIQTVVLVRPWRRRVGLAAAVVLACFGWWAWSNAFETPDTRPSQAVTTTQLFEHLRTGTVPDVELPAYYHDADLLRKLDERAFATKSPLLQTWLQLDSQGRIEVLTSVMWTSDPQWLLAFLAEITYLGSAFEQDPRVADLLRASVLTTSYALPQVALFLLEHVARVSPHDEVRARAQGNVEALRRRLRDLGF